MWRSLPNKSSVLNSESVQMGLQIMVTFVHSLSYTLINEHRGFYCRVDLYYVGSPLLFLEARAPWQNWYYFHLKWNVSRPTASVRCKTCNLQSKTLLMAVTETVTDYRKSFSQLTNACSHTVPYCRGESTISFVLEETKTKSSRTSSTVTLINGMWQHI